MISQHLPPNPNLGINFDEAKLKEIWLAGGCFWGVEAYFTRIYGVAGVTVGYANGKTETRPMKRSVPVGPAMRRRFMYVTIRNGSPLPLYYTIFSRLSIRQRSTVRVMTAALSIDPGSTTGPRKIYRSSKRSSLRCSKNTTNRLSPKFCLWTATI